ncbi:MAG: hypothetical protein OXI37_07900 [Gammaproteobacteria bacterium]|nr:hypothetical protein [Gammaproteobacteria bacterium]
MSCVEWIENREQCTPIRVCELLKAMCAKCVEEFEKHQRYKYVTFQVDDKENGFYVRKYVRDVVPRLEGLIALTIKPGKIQVDYGIGPDPIRTRDIKVVWQPDSLTCEYSLDDTLCRLSDMPGMLLSGFLSED